MCLGRVLINAEMSGSGAKRNLRLDQSITDSDPNRTLTARCGRAIAAGPFVCRGKGRRDAHTFTDGDCRGCGIARGYIIHAHGRVGIRTELPPTCRDRQIHPTWRNTASDWKAISESIQNSCVSVVNWSVLTVRIHIRK